MRYLTVIGLALFCFSFIQKENSRIRWSEQRLLTWADFKGKAPANAQQSVYKAESQTGIDTSIELKQDSLRVRISCYFEKDKSWKITESDYLLQHEQLHFDITELYARKFRQKIHQQRFQLKTAQNELNKIYSEINTGSADMQRDYDKDTQHSLITKAQEEWNRKIQKELDQLKAYTSETVSAAVQR